MTKISTKEELFSFLQTQERKVKEVTLPNGATVCIRTLSESEFSRWQVTAQLATSSTKKEQLRALLATKALCDADGNALLKESDVKQVFEAFDSGSMTVLFDEIVKLQSIDQSKTEESFADTQELAFDFVLAMALGMTIGELKERMSAVEYQAWRAYSNVYPLGELREDIRNGWLVYNVLANQIGSDKVKLEDCVLFTKNKKKRKKQSEDEMKAILGAAIALAPKETRGRS